MTHPAENLIRQQTNEKFSKTCHIDRLIVFARCVEHGQVKTRLIPAIGAERATQTHVALFEKTLSNVSVLYRNRKVDVEIRLSGERNVATQTILERGIQQCEFDVRTQVGSDLGQRLSSAAKAAFSEGAKRVVIIGTDCPDVSGTVLDQAFDQLDTADLVLGPALDGGYYLIGMRRFLPDLFQQIPWGGEQVLEQTLTRTRKLGASVATLEPLSDIDYAEDLVVCRRHPEVFGSVFPTESRLVSIVIPALNEASSLPRTLQQLGDLSGIETIVADGGSSDETCSIAESYSATVVTSRPGRGIQLNTGAAIAQGEVILFLHADTLLPDDFLRQVWQVLDNGAIAGAFRLGIDGPQRRLRLVEAGANSRSRWLQMPYGDQGLFLKSETFFEIGSFQNWPLMEDFEICQRLRKKGRIELASGSVAASARRWQQVGPIRNTISNQFLILAYRFGVSPDRLARWYGSGTTANQPESRTDR